MSRIYSPIECAACGKSFTPRSPRARYCPDNDACRKRGSRAGVRVTDLAERRRKSTASAVTALRAELIALNQLDTYEGAKALELTADPGMDSGSSRAALSREVSRLMDICRDRTSVPRADGLGSIEQGAAAKLSIVK